ncbi:hypothetical protein CLD22_19070 [Rubrivivax gelatinosus]|nr:hypothetical protein [Rubrivivax gelatinosus]
MTVTRTAPERVQAHHALEMLREDHRRLEALCAEYQRLVQADASAADRSGLIARIGGRMRIHARIEDEIFYPALPHSEALQRAHAEHERLDAELRRIAEAGGAKADGGVDALARALAAHARFEEETVFALAAGLDLFELGARLRARRIELTGDYEQPS